MSPELGTGGGASEAPRAVERVLVLGANGPSGRLAVQQALDRGRAVVALTRNPKSFPIRHERLEVIGGDATDPVTVDTAVEGCDAVVSLIGAPFSWRPIEVYSVSARLVVMAMRHHGARRLIVVTSMGTPRHLEHRSRLQRAGHWVFRMTFTRTLYDDMLKMEGIVSRSGLDWTVVRPPVLSDAAAAGYRIASTRTELPVIARADLAAMVLDQLHDTEWSGRIAAVGTPGLRLDVLKTIRRELLKR